MRIEDCPRSLSQHSSPAKLGFLSYVYLFCIGFGMVTMCYVFSQDKDGQTEIRPAPATPDTSPAVFIDPGRTYTRNGVTVVWPKVVKSFAEYNVQYDNLMNVIKRWNPDNPDPPPVFTEALQHFNYSCPVERAVAAEFMEAEMPFKVYDVPEFDEVSKKWTDEYIQNGLKHVHHSIEKAEKNHFMFYKGSGKDIKGWTPPQDTTKLQAKEFQEIARDADATKLSSEEPHYYLTGGVGKYDKKTFIGKDLSLFSTTENNFFVRDVTKNKGIQCRFGMRGVTAASHYDSGRNMVAVFRGTRRYILNPPKACKQLSIYADRKHPSFRHSAIDWSSLAEGMVSGFAVADAIDTIIHPGEVLYIPSYWFHYIVSLEYSAQCNTRHGSPPEEFGKYDIDECFGADIHAKKKHS